MLHGHATRYRNIWLVTVRNIVVERLSFHRHLSFCSRRGCVSRHALGQTPPSHYLFDVNATSVLFTVHRSRTCGVTRKVWHEEDALIVQTPLKTWCLKGLNWSPKELLTSLNPEIALPAVFILHLIHSWAKVFCLNCALFWRMYTLP